MIIHDLPLHDLFDRLRQAGLPLGIDEYELLLQALMTGFGISDRDALARLCKTLWIKSTEEAQLFDYHFAEVMAQAPVRESLTPDLQPPSAKAEPKTITAAESITPELAINPEPVEATPPTPPPDLTLEIEDEIQVAKSVSLYVSDDDEIADSRFPLTSDYLPVTRRQMKQSWRYLRRPLREGPPVELDVEATVNRIARQGMLLEAVLVPHRINRAELILLIDQDGSMVPFHSLGDRLMETAVRGGRLGKTGIYYFHNCPVDYLYRDPGHQQAETFAEVLRSLSIARSSILIFSDGGAARGNFSSERLELTETFLNQFKQRVRYMAWLNPVPISRWQGTTAGKIAQLIPMFELSRPGLQDAIGVLRGRPTNFAGVVR